MPLVKIYAPQGVYERSRLEKVSQAVHRAFAKVLNAEADDFFKIVFEMPDAQLFHPPSFNGHFYSEEFILLEITAESRRSEETYVTLLEEINREVAAQAGILPDDIAIVLYDIPHNYISFGGGIVGGGARQ